MKNSRNTLAILFFLYSVVSLAQVGIGTTVPAATLDITATNLSGATVDGLLIPRVSRLRAQTMAGTPTSTVLYVNDVVSGSATGTTVNVTAVGFYYFDGTVWVKLGSGATNAWNVTGNSGLSAATNFVGTTDGVDLAFRRNNAASGKIGATSTSFGVNALTAGAATNNAAFGTNALALSTGTDNVAVGNGTLPLNTTGIQNTAVGNAALATNTGNANTAVGNQALNLNAATSNNTAVGFQAMKANTASNNTGIGFQALSTNTVGVQNTSVGFQSATAILNGNRNTAMGYIALGGNIAGNENTAIGNYALGRTTGSGNTAMGHEAEFGSGAAFTNTTAIGWHALFSNSGSNNTALGYNALQGNLTAVGNTAVGSAALNNETGANNTALGTNAGFENATGTNNTYVGFEAGRFNTFAANNNVLMGYQAGLFATGSFNVAIGSNTLKANAATANNVAIGYNALTVNTGTGNVAIGYNAGAAETGSSKLYIENSNGDQSNALIYGDFNTNIARVNGTFQINNPANANGYAMPNVRGTNGQVLQTDGAGATSWVTNSATTLSMVRANLTANQTLTTAGWQKINFNTEAFDTANEFDTATGRFTATKAGFYRINAVFHTNNQSNINLYSIGIYVNGSLYQLTSADHSGSGNVARSATCLVQLAVGGYIEVFAENFLTGVDIDSYSGKTAIEIQQVR
jgi:hypothetical protein